jgi:alpha-mannosidase
MPFGYSNGANLPLDSADALFRQAQEIASLGRTFAAGTPILVMNGTDHTEPDPRLLDRVAEVNRREGIRIEVGRLEDYIKRLSEAPLEGVAVHRGELRSPSRSHLLPGVTSARTWIKQRDFGNCALLERYADPLAAMANAIGASDGMADFLDLAWRTEIQNHPHDSICGCSVDQVHTDMRFRFDQAAMIAENVVRTASQAILQRGHTGAPMLAVFNPTFAGQAVATGAVELDDPSARWAAVDADGRRVPLAVDVARGERAFEVDLPAAQFKSIVAGLSTPQILGRTVNRYEIRQVDGRVELNLSLSRAAISDVDLASFRDEIRNTVPESGTIRVRATNAARCGVSLVANNLAQAGFSFFRLLPDDSVEHPVSASAEAIDNEFYRVEAGARGLLIHDIASGETLELYFEDDGDRGDEYNYDPVPGAATISRPTELAIETVEHGPVRKRLIVRLKLEVPEALIDDRSARSARSCEIPVVLTATLWRGMPRLDLVAEVENRARDHRLRAVLRTPVRATESISDTAFGVLRRPLTPSEPRGTEDIYPTAPHRTVTAVEGESLSAAMMSRGLYEIEARPEGGGGTTLLLTLLRCVGWLSRSDLAMRNGGAGPEMETPGAQEQGAHRFEFAVTTWRGGYLEAGLMQRAAAYAFAARIFAARESASAAAGMQLIRCTNPRVTFSTARPDERPGYFIVRAHSVSPESERAEFIFGDGRTARLVDLARHPLKREGMRRRGGGVVMNLRPFEIVTFRVGGKIFKSEHSK